MVIYDCIQVIILFCSAVGDLAVVAGPLQVVWGRLLVAKLLFTA